jgi:DNA-binding cell septation regulator SpoVG
MIQGGQAAFAARTNQYGADGEHGKTQHPIEQEMRAHAPSFKSEDKRKGNLTAGVVTGGWRGE